MENNKEIILALFTNAHCILKNLYVSSGQSADDHTIMEEVTDIFKHYSDAEIVSLLLSPEGRDK